MSIFDEIRKDRRKDYPLSKILRMKCAGERNSCGDAWADQWLLDAAESLDRLQRIALAAEELAAEIERLQDILSIMNDPDWRGDAERLVGMRMAFRERDGSEALAAFRKEADQ